MCFAGKRDYPPHPTRLWQTSTARPYGGYQTPLHINSSCFLIPLLQINSYLLRGGNAFLLDKQGIICYNGSGVKEKTLQERDADGFKA